MSEPRQRIDPITAERLVRGARTDTPGSDPLAQLLVAAASPARRDELAGEEAAVTAFRAANLARPPTSRRRSLLSTALAKVASVKVAVAVIALSGGGIALAAGSGHLPGVSGSDHRPTAQPDANATTGQHPTKAPASAAPTNPTSSAGSAAPGASGSGSSTSAAPNGSLSPNLRGLCTAFTARAGNEPGKALNNPAFTVLITVAGGKDRVPTYCASLLAEGHQKPSTHPSGDDSSHGASPTHPNGTHGPPSTHPAGTQHTPSHPSPTPPTTHSH
jgi:hypothetical protein